MGHIIFIDIKCRKSGLRPSAVVVVATIRALKYHGGIDLKELNLENVAALEIGFKNLERHVRNVREHYGLPCVVAINHFSNDTDAEISFLKSKLEPSGVPVVVAKHWADGGAGTEDLARTVVALAEGKRVVPKTPSDVYAKAIVLVGNARCSPRCDFVFSPLTRMSSILPWTTVTSRVPVARFWRPR